MWAQNLNEIFKVKSTLKQNNISQIGVILEQLCSSYHLFRKSINITVQAQSNSVDRCQNLAIVRRSGNGPVWQNSLMYFH